MKATRARPAGGAAKAVGVPPLILASRSPRREQLLRMLGLSFEVRPATIDEARHPNGPPAEVAEHLAREKARAVSAEWPEALVIGCDTLVVIDGEVLGKPSGVDDAVRMLSRLSGREHRVETGIAIAAPDGRLESSAEGIRVRFRPLDQRTIEDYVATGEPLDKAGAYGIQGYGATLVDWIEGDFHAVMGLPVARMVSLFRALGWRYNFRGFEPLT